MAKKKRLVAKYTHDGAAEFEKQINDIWYELSEMLKSKNAKYGNSALNPIRVFSRAETTEQIRVRIDDKLSRLRNCIADDEDAVLDLMGYLVLLRVAQKDVKDNGPF